MSSWYAANIVLIQTTLIYCLLSLSFQVVLRSGVFSFASVGFYGIGGYLAAILTLRGVPGVFAFVLALAATALLATLMALVVRRLRGLHLALLTVAFNLILTSVANNGGALTGGPVGLFGVPTVIGPPTMAILVIIAVVVVRQLERGSIGRSFEALRLNEDLARSAGINVDNRRAVVFVLSAVLGAASGVVNVFAFTTISPHAAGFHLVVTALTMAVLGGIGRWQGALVGAVILAWLPSALGPLGDYQAVVNGLIVILLVVYARDGVVGIVVRVWRRLRRGPAALADPAGAGPGPASATPDEETLVRRGT